jgi:hypothetical protein
VKYLSFGDYFVLFIGPLIGPLLALVWMIQSARQEQNATKD